MMYGGMIEMPDAWTILKENSSLESGDAWEHLNNQMGGDGSGYILAYLAEAELMQDTIDIEIVDTSLDIEYVDIIDVEILDDFIETEV